MQAVGIGGVRLGSDAPLVLISGLNVLEKQADAIDCAQTVGEIARRHDIPLVFKASFDKANRTNWDAYRGPGIDEGLRILDLVKRESGLPVMTDVHEAGQAKLAAEVVDCLQVPAFLVRQTDLVAACAATGLPVNLKKGPFIAPENMAQAVQGFRRHGGSDAFITERGTSFGHHDLVADMRGLATMREFAPVCFDATHSVQTPGTLDGSSGGDRRHVAPLARAAVAAGIDALFLEVHPDPDAAPCDAPCQILPAALDTLLGEVCVIDRALRDLRSSDPTP